MATGPSASWNDLSRERRWAEYDTPENRQEMIALIRAAVDRAEHAPQSRLLGGFTMQADQERKTLSQVTRWLGGIQIGK
jgi:hypothetical protein